MDDILHLAIPILVAVAIGGVIGGWKGWDLGSSIAERRIDKSGLKRELEERRTEAQKVVERHRAKTAEDAAQKIQDIETSFAEWLRKVESGFAEQQNQREFELSNLRKKRNNLKTWASDSSSDSTVGSGVSDANLQAVRQRFKKWRDEHSEELAVIADYEAISAAAAKQLAEMEKVASTKGTKAKDELGWSEIKNRMASAEKAARTKREALEDEFVKLETAKLLDQVNSLLSGTDGSSGISARVKALRGSAEDLLTELDRHLKTDEERVTEETPSTIDKVSEVVSSTAEKSAAVVSAGFSKLKTSATGLFRKEKPNAETTTAETTSHQNRDSQIQPQDKE